MHKEYTIIAISDIHLGHPRNPTKNMLDNLDKVMYDNIKLFTTVDMIVFTGDIMHKLLSYSDPDIVLINNWFIDFYTFCTTHNIIVRLLKGTPSHDYDQIESIMSLSKTFTTLDIQYINTIHVEKNDTLGIHILYVPDQCSTPANISMSSIHRVLSDANLSEVDFAFMHGGFDYQIPFNLESSYSIDDFSFVKHYVVIGHIHTHKPNKNILPPGSFDRTAFGETEKKGIIHITVNPHTGAKFIFIENTTAMRFDTIILKSTDLLVNKKKVLAHIAKYPCKEIMLKIDTPNVSYKEISELLKDRGIKPTINKTYDAIDAKEEIIQEDIPDAIEVTPDNIESLLKESIEIPQDLSTHFDKELSGIIETYIL